MGPRRVPRPLLWTALAVVVAIVLLLGAAWGTGAWSVAASHVGPVWWLMPVLMITVMAVVMYVLMMPMMSHGGSGMGHHEMPEDPVALAARRYAKGEISREEYQRIRADLEGRAP